MLCPQRVAQRNNLAFVSSQQDRIQIGATHAHIRGGESERRDELCRVQPFRSHFPTIGVQKLVCLPIQTPDRSCNRVIKMCCHKLIARVLFVQVVAYRLEQRQHLHHGVVLGITAVYRRDLLICNLDQAVARGNAHAVVEDLRKYSLGDFVQCMSGDAGTLQNGLDGTGADGVVLTIDLQQKAGILHRVFKHISRPVVVVDLHVEIAECGSLLNRLKPQVLRRCRHPLAFCLALAKKLKEVPGFAERATEVVREYFGFHHFVVPPFK